MKGILNLEGIKEKFNLDPRTSKNLVNFMQALLSSQTLNIRKTNEFMPSNCLKSSSYRKCQRMISNLELDENACAELVMEFLGIAHTEQVVLIYDRTYWMHGATHINYLYLGIYYRGYAIPLYLKALPDLKGHSSVMDREELLTKFIEQFGKERIAYVTADREFDGGCWLGKLKDLSISYVQRLKENTICISNAKGDYVRAKDLCRHLKRGEIEYLGIRKIYKSRGFKTHVTIARNLKGGLLVVAHSGDIKDATLAYRLRWSIESCFRGMKSGGLNMQATGVKAPKKLENLFRIVALLTAIMHKLGIIIDQIEPIKIRSHGRKSISYIQTGLQFLFRIINFGKNSIKNIKKIASQTLMFPQLFHFLSLLSCTLTIL